MRTGRRATNTRERHAAVYALRAEGLSISATARRLDMNVRTARKYAHAAETLIGPNTSGRPSVLAPLVLACQLCSHSPTYYRQDEPDRERSAAHL
ncbi:helix-turn-helix domain-containing protein [Micromonospora sp. NPDC051925]|uniref:helix-turn-helix domain-containing protein n=1 Tax=Micromonospora sp. NPDC051925 TaxID=3364288 RepID=UPI0037C91061